MFKTIKQQYRVVDNFDFLIVCKKYREEKTRKSVYMKRKTAKTVPQVKWLSEVDRQ